MKIPGRAARCSNGKTTVVTTHRGGRHIYFGRTCLARLIRTANVCRPTKNNVRLLRFTRNAGPLHVHRRHAWRTPARRYIRRAQHDGNASSRRRNIRPVNIRYVNFGTRSIPEATSRRNMNNKMAFSIRRPFVQII